MSNHGGVKDFTFFNADSVAACRRETASRALEAVTTSIAAGMIWILVANPTHFGGESSESWADRRNLALVIDSYRGTHQRRRWNGTHRATTGRGEGAHWARGVCRFLRSGPASHPRVLLPPVRPRRCRGADPGDVPGGGRGAAVRAGDPITARLVVRDRSPQANRPLPASGAAAAAGHHLLSWDAWRDAGGAEPELGAAPWDEPGWRNRSLAALAALPQSQRQALVLRYLDDFPVPEIAAALGRSTHAVESLLARGRAGFKRAYSEAGMDDDA